MTGRFGRVFPGALIGAAVVFLASVTVMGQQAAPAAARGPLAGEVFKNVPALKDIPADDFMGTMGFISNALSMNCTSCHVGEGGGGWGPYASDDKPRKVTARRMITMVNNINRQNFQGRQVVTCISCHNGNIRPKTYVNLAPYYGVDQTDEEGAIAKAPGAPTAEQVIDKFVAAVGGAQKIGALTSFAAKATYVAYGELDEIPSDVYVKPGMFTSIIHTPVGDLTQAYDGRAGWSAQPDAFSPLGVRQVVTTELEGYKLDAELMLPVRFKQLLTKWTGATPTALGDKDIWVIEGTMPSGLAARFYFDQKTGLLARSVRYAQTALGLNPTMVDYDDYRDVNGVKIPHKRTVRWQSGQGTYTLTAVQANAAIDAAKFGKPAK